MSILKDFYENNYDKVKALSEKNKELKVKNEQLKTKIFRLESKQTSMCEQNKELIEDNLNLSKENAELKAQKDKYYQQTLDDEIQINELYQENERLKAECDMYKTFYRAKHSDIKGLLLKYKQTLQEIKAIVCGNYEIIDPQGRKDILKLITKAESEG